MACDDCSYTVCVSCLPPGSNVVCPDCPFSARVTSGASVPIVYGGLSASGDPSKFGGGTIVPAACRVLLKRGVAELRPTAAVDSFSYNSASPLRRARYALLSCVPSCTASGRLASVRLLSLFAAEVARVPWGAIDAEHIADFVMWRVAPPPGCGIVMPPKGPVEAATAMGDLVHLRAHARATASRTDHLYSFTITAVLSRFGANEKHDSVRKTPVDFAIVSKLVRRADGVGATLQEKLDAFLMAMGCLLFLRGSEAGFEKRDLVISPQAVGLVFRRQKTRAGLLSKSVTRFCAAPILLQAYQCVRAHIESLADTDRVFPFGGSAASAWVRAALRRICGPPAVMLGEACPLPWSMRACGATLCFHAGMDVERLMRLGRWSSRVSLMYAVLTAQVQSDIWSKALANEAWYHDKEAPGAAGQS